MRTRSILRTLTALLFTASTGCIAPVADVDDGATADNVMTFEEFEATTPIDSDGAYIVDFDIPIYGREALRAFFEAYVENPGALAVNVENGADEVWTEAQKMNLTYCVSTAFGGRHDDVVTAMAEAVNDWTSAGDYMITYRADQDGSCNTSNDNVTFSVESISGQTYAAKAFFPLYPKSQRFLRLDTDDVFDSGDSWSLAGIIRHELGHVLGFRHEHIRVSQSGSDCVETGSYRALTSYDSASVMHYPQCKGSNDGDLELTSKDKAGAEALYGASGILHNERWITKNGGYQSTGRWVAGDFNGDGKSDIAMTFNDGGSYSSDVFLSTGSSFSKQRWTTKAGGYQSTAQWVAGDFNDDGKADMAMIFSDGGNYSVDVYLSTGSGFSKQRWITKAGGYQAEGQWVAGDFNADGKSDIAVAFSDGGSISIDAYISSGSSFGIQRWTTKAGGWPSNGSKWVAGDFNGDGKDDMAMPWSNDGKVSIDAYISGGSSFGMQRWSTKQGAWKSTGWVAGDFDGNGKDDLSKAFEDEGAITIDVNISLVSTFPLQRWQTTDGGWQNDGSWVSGDFDDDGAEETAVAFNDGGYYSIDLHTR